VPTASDGDAKVIFPAKVHRSYYVGDVRAPDDKARSAADHRVIDLPSFIVARIGRGNQFTTQLTLKGTKGLFLHD